MTTVYSTAEVSYQKESRDAALPHNIQLLPIIIIIESNV